MRISDWSSDVCSSDLPDAQLYASLAASFPGQMVDFASHTEDGKLIVVSVYSDTNPGELYLYNRDTGKARSLMQGRKWLDKDAMADRKRVGEGKSGSVRVDLGGGRSDKKKRQKL